MHPQEKITIAAIVLTIINLALTFINVLCCKG